MQANSFKSIGTFLVCVLMIGITFGLSNSHGQAVDARVTQHLDAGEIPRAISVANSLNKGARDIALAQVAQTQFQSGSPNGAFQTAKQITSDVQRAGTLNNIHSGGIGGGAGGQGGGITEADFNNLIDLITGTIKQDSWQVNGAGLGTIQAYPAGVYVDPTGTLSKLKVVENDQLDRIRQRARDRVGSQDWTSGSDLRMISLTRLEKAAHVLAAQGKPIDPMMRNLGGMYEVKYLMTFPETGDIVIAGPAGPWKLDQENRPVNVENGKPVLQLDDLVVCLRNAWDNNGKFGCSITPRKKNLAQTKAFLASSKLKGKRWSKGIREALGQQDVEVVGIEPTTHAARVLVEADYRMKLLGMGLEKSIPEVPSYFDRVKLGADGSVPPMDVVRWWFTLNYDDITQNDDATMFTFNGTGVKVLSENEFINDQGDRIHTGKSQGPTKSFARDFTKHFDKLADKYPVYRQLKNVFDMALVSSLIRRQGLSGQVEWHRTFFATPAEGDSGLHYQVRHDRIATQVNSVLNEKFVKVRKQRSTVKHHLVGVSGGISYDVGQVLTESVAKDKTGVLAQTGKVAKPTDSDTHWFWD